jgi:adenylate kinase family enzyme
MEPHVIIIVGCRGSGKTTTTKQYVAQWPVTPLEVFSDTKDDEWANMRDVPELPSVWHEQKEQIQNFRRVYPHQVIPAELYLNIVLDVVDHLFVQRNSHLQELTFNARHYGVRLFLTTPKVSVLPRWLWKNADMIVLQNGYVSAVEIVKLRNIYRGTFTLQPNTVNDRTEVYRVD